MKKLILFIALFPTLLLSTADTYAQSGNSDFSRDCSYAIRPELYGAVVMEFGYHFHPQIQGSLGIGLEIGEDLAYPEILLGARIYASETKWTAFLDYHLGFLLINGLAVPSHRFTVGPSFKNFDFGGGILYANINGEGAVGVCVNIGYNFRFPSKK